MPRFFFDLHDLYSADPEGVDLPSVVAAEARALAEAREMICSEVHETGRMDLRHHIDVRDEAGAIVCVLHFEDAVTVQRGDQLLSQPKAA